MAHFLKKELPRMRFKLPISVFGSDHYTYYGITAV